MSVIALTAAVLLASQTSIPAPRYGEADVVRLESCVFGGDDMAKCGDFSAEVDALQTCAAAANLGEGPEGFADQWSKCDFVLPCQLEKPEPDQTTMALRNCSARGVAASKILAGRWITELSPRLQALLDEERKGMLADLEMPAGSDEPLRASAHWSGSWTAYLQFLRFVQLTSKAAP